MKTFEELAEYAAREVLAGSESQHEEIRQETAVKSLARELASPTSEMEVEHALIGLVRTALEAAQAQYAAGIAVAPATVLDRRLYATQGLFLEHAQALQADAVTIEDDMGALRYTLAEAEQKWDELMPGEGFTIQAIHFENGARNT